MENNNTESITFYQLYKDFIAEYRTVLLFIILALLIGVGYLFSSPVLYEASAKVQVMQIMKKNDGISMSSEYQTVEEVQKTKELLDNVVPAQILTTKGRLEGVLLIVAHSKTQEQAKKDSEETYEIIKSRYEEIFSTMRLNGFLKVIPTKIMGEINVSAYPVTPNKKVILITSLFSGIIIGFFIAYLRILINRSKRYHEAK